MRMIVIMETVRMVKKLLIMVADEHCGINMRFVEVFKTILLQYSFPVYQCRQRCVCAKNNIVVNGRKCIQKECILLYQIVTKAN